MFFAALTSLSCIVPHSAQDHSLIRKPALPFGLLPEISPQHEQVWEVFFSFTSANTTDRTIALYSSCVFSMCQTSVSIPKAACQHQRATDGHRPDPAIQKSLELAATVLEWQVCE